jgi:sugar-specific transcriptional regulator TrmB
MSSPPLDLAPFGFTPTESRVYATLLRLGPSTYGALQGLVTRRAATRLVGRPARYRALDPSALMAQLAAEQGQALERLGRALKDVSQPAEPETRSLEGARAIANLTLQLVARAERRVEGIIAPELLRATLPAWRRAATRAQLALRVAGDVPAEAGALVAGSAAPEAPTVLLIDDVQTVAVDPRGGTLVGAWSSHPAILALARTVLASVT